MKAYINFILKKIVTTYVLDLRVLAYFAPKFF